MITIHYMIGTEYNSKDFEDSQNGYYQLVDFVKSNFNNFVFICVKYENAIYGQIAEDYINSLSGK